MSAQRMVAPTAGHLAERTVDWRAVTMVGRLAVEWVAEKVVQSDSQSDRH
jgi:hypothetical protein